MMLEKKADNYSKYGMIFVLGWLACSAYYRIPLLWQKQNELVKVETNVIPKLANAAGCQTARARVAQDEAIKSEHGADVDLSKIPTCPTPQSVMPAKKVAPTATK